MLDARSQTLKTILLKVVCFNCVLCESETNSHLLNDKFYCISK